MSEANQPQAADREQAYCWIFNARLKIQRPRNTFGQPDPYLIPATYFEDVLNKCDGYQRSVLKRMEALSYAYNPEWFDLLPGDVLPVTGIMVYKGWIRRVTVEDWLRHEDLDVDWNPCIGRRDKDPRVTEFLTQSSLHDDFFAARAAGMDDRVPNLRVDKIGQSAPKRNGRPPKRPQPDAGFNDAADGGRMLAPAHARPAPADSTPPDAAAAAGAGGASGPQPSPAAPAAEPAVPAGDPTTTPPTPARLSDASSPPGLSPQLSDTPGSAGLSSPDTDSVVSSAAAAAEPRPRALGRTRSITSSRMQLSNQQYAGVTRPRESDIERLLAECQKTNQRLERLISVIECIGRAEER